MTRVATQNPVPLAWCGESAPGFTTRWRNVLFSDLTVRRVPEVGMARFLAVRPLATSRE